MALIFFSKLKIFFVKKTCLKFCIQIKKCLGKNETEWIMRTNLGKLNYEGLNCGELSLDEYPVHVGSSVLSGQLCTGKNQLACGDFQFVCLYVLLKLKVTTKKLQSI